MKGGGVLGALIFTIGVLIVFALLFSTFLIVPFFVFLGGIIAMLISDRNRGRGNGNGNGNDPAPPDDGPVEVVEVVETTEVREVKS